MLAAIERGGGPGVDDQRGVAGASCGGPGLGGLVADDGEPGRARSKDVCGDERGRGEGGPGAGRDPRGEGAWIAREGQCRDPARRQRGGDLPLVRMAREEGVVMRFIEYMDVGETNGWDDEEVVPAQEILRVIGGEFPLEPLDPSEPGEVARRFRLCGRQRGDRDHFLGDPSVLRGLPALARVGGGEARSPACSRRRGPTWSGSAGRLGRRGGAPGGRGPLGGAQRPVFGAEGGGPAGAAAEGGDVLCGRLIRDLCTAGAGL